jgi:hypothetical protein
MTPFILDIAEEQQRQDAGGTPASNTSPAAEKKYWIDEDDEATLTEEEHAEMEKLLALLESRMQDVYQGNVVSKSVMQIFEETLGKPTA